MIVAALQALAGLVCGYVTISICESFFHRVIQHASPGQRGRYARLGRLGRALQRAWFAHHGVHHCLTYRRDHVTQFESEAGQARLDALLAARRRCDIIASRYGTIIGGRMGDYVRYMAPTLPLLLAFCWIGGVWFTLGALVPLVAWPMLAQAVHPWLHRPYDEVRRQAPRWIAAGARSAYFRYLARHHWLHHRYGDCNYNLLLGGDQLLGVHRTASRDDLAAMRAIGLWVPPVPETDAGARFNNS